MKHPALASNALALMLACIATSPLGAECVAISVPHAKRESARVLEGTVTKIEGVGSVAPVVFAGVVATVTVHRVWRGVVTPEATFYYEANIEGPQLKVGERRIIFGRLMGPGQRARFGVPADGPQSFYVGCSDAPEPMASVIRDLGRARTVPKAQPY